MCKEKVQSFEKMLQQKLSSIFGKNLQMVHFSYPKMEISQCCLFHNFFCKIPSIIAIILLLAEYCFVAKSIVCSNSPFKNENFGTKSGEFF
jgi:hypothetical protein